MRVHVLLCVRDTDQVKILCAWIDIHIHFMFVFATANKFFFSFFFSFSFLIEACCCFGVIC